MSLFDAIFKNRPKERGKYQGYFKMLNGYRPVFTSWSGGLYESELIRSAIHAKAKHISKLKIETQGAARPRLTSKLRHAPNSYQTWSQFLYRLDTILEVHNTAYIVPVFDEYGEPSGLFPVLPSRCSFVQYDGVPYLRYEFSNGDKAAVELAYCGIMVKHQYKDDLTGESNGSMLPTMDLIHIQNQGIKEGVKSAASYRYIAKLDNFTSDDDLKKEREAFSEMNFGKDANGGGLLLFPHNYTDIKQVDAKPWIVDSDQMKIIKANVFDYFGVNEELLQSDMTAEKWASFYESEIEWFAVQFSEVCTKMLYTLTEQSNGNRVIATANRLQYMSNADKLNVSTQLLDRGIISINDAREIWNLPPVDGGDERVIRGEYYNVDDKVTEGVNNDTEDDNG